MTPGVRAPISCSTLRGADSLEDFVRIDAFDDVADGSPFDGAAGTGDDDLIELDGALRECEVGGDRLPRGYRDRAILWRVAEHSDAQLHTARGDGAERVFARGVGSRADLRAVPLHRRL